MDRLIGILFLIFISITSIVLFLGACLTWACTVVFDRKLKILHQYTCFWASIYTWVMPAWPIRIEGRNKIRRNATYIYISNHQSQLDILVLFRLFVHFKWVSKSEIFKVPLIGWNMRFNRYIQLRRGEKESVIQMMADCERTLAEGSSIFIFPEGTRSNDGNLKPFKSGAFILAKKMKVPILPIVVNGTKDALPKHSVNYHGKHPIKVRVLDEISYSDFESLTEEELSKKTWDLVNSTLREMQGKTSSTN